jgi:nucleoside-diphosphate-sugar epimerase
LVYNRIKKEYSINYSYLIPSVFYGPEYDLHDKHFIFDLIRKIVNAKNGGDKVVLWGTGEQTRELIFIKDAVDIIIKAMDWDKEIVNYHLVKNIHLKNMPKQYAIL